MLPALPASPGYRDLERLKGLFPLVAGEGAQAGFLHLPWTFLRELLGIPALPFRFITIPLGGVNSSASSNLRHQPCPELNHSPCLSCTPHCQPPCCPPPSTDSPEHATAPASMLGCPIAPASMPVCVSCTCPCFSGTPHHRCCPRTLSCRHIATLLCATCCPYSLSRTAGNKCLPLEWMPVSLCEHGLAVVPSTRSAQG